jgi:uncharacterized membrane protein YoaK (UPF0700 family)
VLTFAAGCVDIVGYLSAYHTFTAHMTGNTVHLGNSLFGGDIKEAGLASLVLIAFVGGSLAGRALIQIGARKRIRAIASWTLGIEAALLAIVASGALGGLRAETGLHYPKTALALLAIAMGLQTATITRVGALTVHTTFVTGMINKFCQLVSQVIFDVFDAVTGKNSLAATGRLQHRRQTIRKAWFIFSIWCTYTAGAIAGTGLESKWELRSLFVPVALLCVAIVADQVLPLSVEEEKDQSER